MSFADYTIMWHVYPLGFVGAPIRPEVTPPLTHSIKQVENWLDYLINMGANCLQLGPIFHAETHGYDTIDYFTVDPRLGTEDDVVHLINVCRDKGISVILDGVFNHIGRAHPLVAQIIEEGPAGDHQSMLHVTWDDAGTPTFGTFEGHEGLVELNHSDQRVVDLVVEVMLYWMQRGVAGWRLDAAYQVPAAFWTQVVARVREEFPDAWFVGEIIHGDYAAYVRESDINSVTQYELWKAIWSSINDANFFELDWCLTRNNDFLDTFTPMTFIGNHDVTRIATQIGDAGAALAAFILFTIGGVPNIYYGDEQAFRGQQEKRVGGDDAVRPPYPMSPDELPQDGMWLYRLYQELIACRRRHPWLVHARTRTLELTNTRYVYESYGADPSQVLRVELDWGERKAAQISAGTQVLVAYTAG